MVVLMGDLFLGIDVGTSGAKALVIDASGAVIAAHTEAYELLSPQAQWSEQRPSDWWAGTIASIKRVLEAEGVTAEAIGAIGLTGQMHGLVVLDADDEPMRPAILWNDQRTAAECRLIEERVGAARMLAITGKPVLTGFTAPKIMWLREHEPEVLAGASAMLLPKDYVRFCLSGILASDVADASGTSLFDIGARDWSAESIRGVDLKREWLPRVFESSEICAQVRAAGAAATGLLEGTPIVAGAGDQAAEAVGCGIIEEGAVSVTIGTSGVVFAATPSPQIDPAGKMHAYCHAVPGMWHTMGVMLSAGGCLQWYRDTLCAGEVAAARDGGVDVYDLLTGAAREIEAGAEGLFFLPYLTGERTPHADPDARGAFIGLTRRHTKAHLTRAVLEGVSFGLRDLFNLAEGMAISMETVRISGGGARSALWRQILADVLERTNSTVNATQGAAYGAALLAGVGAECFASVPAACGSTIREMSTTLPGVDARTYRDRYGLYASLYPRLAPFFEQIAGH